MLSPSTWNDKGITRKICEYKLFLIYSNNEYSERWFLRLCKIWPCFLKITVCMNMEWLSDFSTDLQEWEHLINLRDNRQLRVERFLKIG